jgi:hypothetical protein
MCFCALNTDALCVHIENLDCDKCVIFVPDSKTPEGRRLVPMSRRVLRRREWNRSCSNRIMTTLALRDFVTLKEQS